MLGLTLKPADKALDWLFCLLQVVFDRLKGMALVLYSEIEYAQAAVKDTKGRKLGGNKIKVCTLTKQRLRVLCLQFKGPHSVAMPHT